MTAVALQSGPGPHRQQYNPRQSPHSSNGHSPHQSRPQSYAGSAASSQAARQDSAGQALASTIMNPRPAVNNEPVQAVNGTGYANGETSQDPRLSSQNRPLSTADSSQDESERERPKRRPKPLLARSKSDYGPRGDDQNVQTEQDLQDWGARHGFEDHYASEEYVSQLANVGCSFLD